MLSLRAGPAPLPVPSSTIVSDPLASETRIPGSGMQSAGCRQAGSLQGRGGSRSGAKGRGEETVELLRDTVGQYHYLL